MKQRKKKNGFKITLFDTEYSVFFKIINNWKTICIISTDDGVDYRGVAKCNLELDTYNEADGKVLSFERAFEKLQKTAERSKVNFLKRYENTTGQILKGITYRFDKMIKKGEI